MKDLRKELNELLVVREYAKKGINQVTLLTWDREVPVWTYDFYTDKIEKLMSEDEIKRLLTRKESDYLSGLYLLNHVNCFFSNEDAEAYRIMWSTVVEEIYNRFIGE